MSITITNVRMLPDKETTFWDVRDESNDVVSVDVGHIYMHNGPLTDLSQNHNPGQFYVYDSGKGRFPKNFLTFHDALETLESDYRLPVLIKEISH